MIEAAAMRWRAQCKPCTVQPPAPTRLECLTCPPAPPAVNGYEGTGRSLSLKLIQQLRAQGAKLASGDKGGAGGGAEAAGSSSAVRTFREVILGEPIRWVGACCCYCRCC